MSVRLTIANWYLKRFEMPKMERETDVSVARENFEKTARRVFYNPPFARYSERSLGGIPATWATSGQGPKEGVILYFHGGGYFFGSSQTGKRMLASLAGRVGMDAVLPDYRLAPEDPFPAAFEDAVASYRGLLDLGYAADDIVMGGDSAGGGLVLALLGHICDHGLPMPKACFALSPWTDLTLCGETHRSNCDCEVVLPTSRVSETRDTYVGNADPSDPRISPCFADFTGACPVFLQVGDREILLDDTRVMKARLEEFGVDVRAEVWENTPHVWPYMEGHFPEARAALDDVAQFIAQRMGRVFEPAAQVFFAKSKL